MNDRFAWSEKSMNEHCFRFRCFCWGLEDQANCVSITRPIIITKCQPNEKQSNHVKFMRAFVILPDWARNSSHILTSRMERKEYMFIQIVIAFRFQKTTTMVQFKSQNGGEKIECQNLKTKKTMLFSWFIHKQKIQI